VSGAADFIDGVAARHGLGVAKRLQHGAVLHVTREQLAALASDPEVASISLDTPVTPSMGGLGQRDGRGPGVGRCGGPAGHHGRGVTVAVIDSGVSEHRDLRSQVVAHLDFTTANGAWHRPIRARHARRGDHRRAGG